MNEQLMDYQTMLQPSLHLLTNVSPIFKVINAPNKEYGTELNSIEFGIHILNLTFCENLSIITNLLNYDYKDYVIEILIYDDIGDIHKYYLGFRESMLHLRTLPSYNYHILNYKNKIHKALESIINKRSYSNDAFDINFIDFYQKTLFDNEK